MLIKPHGYAFRLGINESHKSKDLIEQLEGIEAVSQALEEYKVWRLGSYPL